MSNKSGVSEQVISLPKGGGALHGIGEKFAPDLYTGTGNFSVPIAVPPGRNGFQPELTLTYSTGNGNGPFGLGWALSVPGVSLKTSKGVPRYQGEDTYIFSGAEDLVLVEEKTIGSGTQQELHRYYRPRTEGLFARIVHITGNGEDRWEVTSKSGLKSVYGKDAGNRLYDEEHPDHIFQWLLSETVDTYGNRIVYTYKREDSAELDKHRYEANHSYNQLYLSKIEYGDYLSGLSERFLFSIEFDYGEYDQNGNLVGTWDYRPDPFSTYRAGFEIRTVRRCRRVLIKVHEENGPLGDRLIKSYQLRYLDELSEQERGDEPPPPNGTSLLSEVTLTGYRADQEDSAQDSSKVWNCGWLADGSMPSRYIPVDVSRLPDITDLKTGGPSLALRSDGTVWAWGHNEHGQLGDGTTSNRFAPVQVSELTGVIRIASGDAYGLALTSDGKVWAWGQNAFGRLGNGTQEDKPVPVPAQVGDLSGVVEIAAGEAHSLALKADGTVWAWGYNSLGRLGDGTETNRPTPVKVSSLEGVVAIAAGNAHSLALKSDGTVWAWGRGQEGQLGDGTWTFAAHTPVRVSNLDGVVAIAGGTGHSLALTSDGRVWAWGANNAKAWSGSGGGQLGDGTTTNRSIPVRVDDLVGIVEIAGGEEHSLALRSDGTVWAWGANAFGQLGDGTTTDKLAPVRAGGLIGVVTEISAGTRHSLALTKQAEATSEESLPPLKFGYTRFEPERRRYQPFSAVADYVPDRSLAHKEYELVDLFGNGLPSVFQMNGTTRYWRNLGGGVFDMPRFMENAPAGAHLEDAGVQLADMNGDGRADLLVTDGVRGGYYPLTLEGEWDPHSYVRYKNAPSVNLEDPEVKLVDLDGDGVVDALRTSTSLELYYNDGHNGNGWADVELRQRKNLDAFPDVNFSDPRVKLANMSGGGLQDIVLVHNGRVDYWPYQGYGRWGQRITMRNSPRFEDGSQYGGIGYDPKRVLLGDVDGDGVADLVYVGSGHITVWINQSGNAWSDPITIQGTPPITDMDAVRLADMHGTGTAGILWSYDYNAQRDSTYKFLDLTGEVKPYLMNEMDNHMGALTRVEYSSSTRFYQEDQRRPETRWETPLPFPVQVVARVEMIDEISQGKLTTEYKYHHGYWDGFEREFRGFGMVEQFDTESFEEYNEAGLHGSATEFARVQQPEHFSPPTLTKTWFHQGPVDEGFGEWREPEGFDKEFWGEDPQILPELRTGTDPLEGLQGRARRDALRALRGRTLRTELYALDGDNQRQGRPYTVTEQLHSIREESPPAANEPDRLRIFFPHTIAQRTTQWERGNDPMTRLSFTEDYDEYGLPRKQTQIACPFGWRKPEDVPRKAYLATRSRTAYARPVDPETYIMDRVATATTYEIENNGNQTVLNLKDTPDNSPSLRVIGQTLNFYDRDTSKPDNGAFLGLPFGHIGAYGALVRTESLVLTEEILHKAYKSGDTILTPAEEPPYLTPGGSAAWPDEYPQEFRDRLPALAGYTYRPGGAEYQQGYFAATERRRYDFHDDPNGKGRGLVKIKRDPLGHDTTITYDEPYELLPTEVTDPLGMKTRADYDYQVLQPGEVTDPNGNHTRFTFTPLGLLKDTWVLGKPANNEGDRQRPSARMQYDLLAFANRKQPVYVRTIRQVHHDTETDVPLPQRDETIATVEYSDGFGRLLQTRTQAEDVVFGEDPTFGNQVLPADQTDPGGDVAGHMVADPANKPRVVVSGWQVYDNKGRVVEKYEPFFSEGWDYVPPTDAQLGQKATMFYDPRGQVIRTVNPDGSEQRVVHGVPADLANPDVFAPTPWEAYTYDANDNAGRTHPASSTAYQGHWNTPASAVADALGRTIQMVERNGTNPAVWYTTRSTYDIRGNLLTVTDPLERIAFEHVYDLANRALRTEQLDVGLRRVVVDVAGNPVEQRDSKGALVLHAYDALNRPVHLWARDGTGQPLTLRERLVYGDDGDSGLTGTQAADGNLLGKPYKHYDEAGLLVFETYDFKGNVLEKTRQVVKDEAILAKFEPPPPNWQVEAFRVDWQLSGSDELLEAISYRTSLAYDALNRIKTMRYPQDVDGARKELRPRYNRAGALEHVELDGNTYVERIAYNAKGQRTLIAYGNGVMTRHAYDPKTFRLLRMRTERYTKADALTYRPEPSSTEEERKRNLLQDFAYEYDLVGNIVALHDRTPDSGVSPQPDQLDRAFTYDPIYRLLSATGRECDVSPPAPWEVGPRCTDPTLTRSYAESYQYDPAGNMEQLQHQANGGSFTREISLTPNSNRLETVTVGEKSYAYSYDPNGNLVQENAARYFEWDHSDRMRVYRTQAGNSEPSVHAHYLYDSGGQRVKKLVRKKGQVEVTVYVDGLFEHQRVIQGNTTQENNTLHAMDNQSRMALVRIGNPFPDDTTPAVKYHLGDHLGSSNVVIDDAGSWVNREEYTPYGETSFGSFARKRYRFTGKERDEESGLYYHGARYYAPWLARWTSCDPAGMVDGLNLHSYVRNRPTMVTDSSGTQGDYVDIGADPELQSAAAEANASNIDLTDTRAQATPAQQPMSKDQARMEANTGARSYRNVVGMQDPDVQAGHTAAARHAPESGIQPQDMNDPATFQQLHSRKGKGLDVEVTTPSGETKTTTRHRSQELLIDDAVSRVKAANAGKLTPQGQLDAAAEVRWRTENTPMDQRDVETLRTSKVATSLRLEDSVHATPNRGSQGSTILTTPNRGPQGSTVLTTPNQGAQGSTVLTTPNQGSHISVYEKALPYVIGLIPKHLFALHPVGGAITAFKSTCAAIACNDSCGCRNSNDNDDCGSAASSIVAAY